MNYIYKVIEYYSIDKIYLIYKPMFRITIIAYHPSSSFRRNIQNGLLRLDANRLVVSPMKYSVDIDGETAD